MLGPSSSALVLSIICFLGTVLLSIPHFHQLYQRFTRRSKYAQLHDQYEDKDGLSTHDSQQAYSDIIPRLILLLLALVGSADSLIISVLATVRPDVAVCPVQWVHFGAWIVILGQAVTIYTTTEHLTKFRLGLFSGFSCLLSLVAILAENLIFYNGHQLHLVRNVYATFTLVQAILSFLSFISAWSIPRRPDVYRNGQVVDNYLTTSLLGRYTISWPTNMLAYVTKHQEDIEIKDLPVVPFFGRSQYLNEGFATINKKQRIWWQIVQAHRVTFVILYALQTISSLTNFFPNIALLYILRSLEARDAGETTGPQAWFWAVSLGLSMAITDWSESHMFFFVFLKTHVPIYEQLSAVIFSKAMRRKDAKSASKKKDDGVKTIDTEATVQMPARIVTEAPKIDDEDDLGSDDEEDATKSKQSTINLIGIDSYRVAEFAGFNTLFWGTFIQIIVALIFLYRLVSWIPLLAGLLVPLLLTPANIFLSKRYADTQDRLMKVRDQKLALVSEALQGIRQIKFSALERQWQGKILGLRGKELKTQWNLFIIDTYLIGCWILGPILLASVTLSVYAIVNGTLTPSVAFTTISVFEMLQMTLAVVPEFVTEMIDAKVAAVRIEKFLNSAEKREQLTPGDTIHFGNATISWPNAEEYEGNLTAEDQSEQSFRLHDLNLSFPKNQLSVISGKTGSGKSLLLASLLGECELLEGTITVPRPPPAYERYDDQANPSNWLINGSMAFVAQIPWIENATIRDNVLFGLPLIENRYKRTLSVCALDRDLTSLTDGDMTDIGANGINLSGGQKWRVSFARALYSRADILVLDDIFSAVDAHVGRTLFEEALTGDLGKGRTRILVTHHVGLCLPKTNYSVLLGDGQVLVSGATEELRKSGELKKILAYDVEEQENEDDRKAEDDNSLIDDGGNLQKMFSRSSRPSGLRRASTAAEDPTTKLRRQSTANQTNVDMEMKPVDAPKKFVEDETKHTGRIQARFYKQYISSSGGVSWWALIMGGFVLVTGILLLRSWWVAQWTRSYQTESEPDVILFINFTPRAFHQASKALQSNQKLKFYLSIYVGISVANCFFSTIRYFLVFVASIKASRILFEKLTFSILRAPLRYLDTTPAGRILNRFTADFDKIDSRISMDLAFALNDVFSVLSVVLAGIFVSPIMIILAAALLAIDAYFGIRYLVPAREVKRLESNAKSPVFETFGAALTGLATIRAFDKTQEYIQKMYITIDRHATAYWHMWLLNRWMGFRLNMMGALFVSSTALLIVGLKHIDASLAGFALSFALDISGSVMWALRHYANIELGMNAIERVVEYSEVQTEDLEGNHPPASWPTEGALEVRDLVVAYAEDLPPVLKGLTFSVRSKHRVGVVGRTGAGKSSLTLALFRFLTARQGTILIDGIDVSKITLHDLRSRLAIIPQDPVLFSGTVRSNLDLFNEHDDTELLDALVRVQLITAKEAHTSKGASARASGTATPISASAAPSDGEADAGAATAAATPKNLNIFTSLASHISEGGLNLSQGQRQLLCLARAIVSRPKIMVLDEATSAVDMETDALIQRSIREEFQDSTLIVIAHRLSTIADFDRILVMGDGMALEYDEPRLLMEKKGGPFREMVEASGEREELERVIAENHRGHGV